MEWINWEADKLENYIPRSFGNSGGGRKAPSEQDIKDAVAIDLIS